MRRSSRAGVLAGLAALGVGAGITATASATAPPTTTAAPTTVAPAPSTAPASSASPTSTAPAVTSATSVAPSAAPTTSVAPTTTTTTAPPRDLLAGVPWIQRTFASPCSETAVQMVAGGAIDGSALAVVDDVLPLEPQRGRALAFLSCHAPDGAVTETTALLVQVSPGGFVASLAEQELGANARVVAVQLPSFTVEAPEGVPADGSCCAPYVRRRTFTVGTDGFVLAGERQVAAFLQDIGAPAVGGDGDLVRTSVSAAALCYRWDNVYLTPADPGEQTEISEPTAELQTVRLALIHVTGRWITPSSYMTQEMSDVVTAYQELRGLTVDGQVGAETTSALSADLGCPESGSFDQIVPSGLGPRRFASVTDLLTAIQRYVTSGSTGNGSFDVLLATAGWDGANSMFLGCYRWESPPSGVSCSWSGRTPLQLIGLVDDPTSDGLAGFSILYARSAAAG